MYACTMHSKPENAALVAFFYSSLLPMESLAILSLCFNITPTIVPFLHLSVRASNDMQ